MCFAVSQFGRGVSYFLVLVPWTRTLAMVTGPGTAAIKATIERAY
jgi:hypothetical protein